MPIIIVKIYCIHYLMIFYFYFLILAYSYNFYTQAQLLQNSQYHYIPSGDYFIFVYSTTQMLNTYFGLESLSSKITITNSTAISDNYLYDVIVFTQKSIYQQSIINCYKNSIILELFDLTNCSINCIQCNDKCIQNCFFSNQTSCCCSGCNNSSYSIQLFNNTELSSIENSEVIVIIDNTYMFGNSNQTISPLQLIITYQINLLINKKQKITLYVTLSCFIISLIGLLILCASLTKRINKAQKQLQFEKEMTSKML